MEEEKAVVTCKEIEDVKATSLEESFKKYLGELLTFRVEFQDAIRAAVRDNNPNINHYIKLLSVIRESGIPKTTKIAIYERIYGCLNLVAVTGFEMCKEFIEECKTPLEEVKELFHTDEAK